MRKGRGERGWLVEQGGIMEKRVMRGGRSKGSNDGEGQRARKERGKGVKEGEQMKDERRKEKGEKCINPLSNK